MLYVSGLTTERCGQENIVAYAAYCQLEAELDRWAGLMRSSATFMCLCHRFMWVWTESCHTVNVCVCVCLRAPPQAHRGLR